MGLPGLLALSDTSLEQEGLTLFEAARVAAIPFSKEVTPQDREIISNGLRLHYLDWAPENRRTILFLHGALQQAHSWDFIALALSHEYRVLALDARGHGDTQWATDGDYSQDAHQRDLDGFVEGVGLDSFILVGHSMGGRNAFVFGSRHPATLRALAIVDVGPESMSRGQSRIRRFRELPDELDSYHEFADRVQEYTGRPRQQVLGALKYSIRQRSDGKWTWKYDKLLRSTDHRPRTWSSEKLWRCLADIDCPTLVVRGGDSDIFSNEVMERMLEVIPDSTSAVVPRAGHLVAGDNPTGFLDALRTLLDRV